jgi:hypothetical protein
VAEGWRAGPAADKGARWEPHELDEVVPALLKEARPNVLTDGVTPEDLG